MRDQDDRGAELLLQFQDQIEDLRLDRHVQRGRRLVGDQHPRVAGERHRDHRPLPHAAGELVRVFARPLCRLGDFDELQHLDGFLVGGGLREILVQPQRFGDLVADRQHRVERGHRLLKDHRNVVAADIAHFVFVELQQVFPLQRDRAADDLSWRIGDQPHDRQRRHRLAAAGFADYCQGLAAPQRERDVIYGFDDARPGEEVGLQALDVDRRTGLFGHFGHRVGG